jgi:hypothetical protein
MGLYIGTARPSVPVYRDYSHYYNSRRCHSPSHNLSSVQRDYNAHRSLNLYLALTARDTPNSRYRNMIDNEEAGAVDGTCCRGRGEEGDVLPKKD